MSQPSDFDLSDAQRAMLEEMGIRVWWPSPPEAPAAAPAAPAAAAPSPVAAAQAPLATPMAPATPLPAGVDHMDWDTLAATAAQCQACGLCQGRSQAVFGVGPRNASWMVVGEAPDEHEDRQGEPFAGQVGQLLDNMLRAVGRSRMAEGRPEGLQGAYIANALKCRPPGSRNPSAQELATCAPYLQRQVALVQPRIILAMGRFAVQALLGSTEPLGKLRGRVHQHQGVPVVVTYHPAYLLRNPADKAKAWADLCLALQTEQPG